MLKYKVKGQILEGTYSPLGTMMVLNDEEHTGGYYILIWPQTSNSSEDIVYDMWFENLKMLKFNMKELNWKIKWSDDGSICDTAKEFSHDAEND